MRTAFLAALAIGALLPMKTLSDDRPWATRGFIDDCRAYTGMMQPDPVGPITYDTVFGSGFCYGVVEGIVATISRDFACVPRDKSTRDHIATLMKFVDQYREAMSLDQSSAASVVIQALVVEYPCPLGEQD